MIDPVPHLEPQELREAYWKQQKIYDKEDMENELDCNADFYAEQYGTDKRSVTEEELCQMAGELRLQLDADADAVWSSCRCRAAEKILKQRSREGKKEESPESEPREFLYTTGIETPEILGSGSNYHNVFRTTDEKKAFEAFQKEGRNYLHRKDNNGKTEWWYSDEKRWRGSFV